MAERREEAARARRELRFSGRDGKDYDCMPFLETDETTRFNRWTFTLVGEWVGGQQFYFLRT